MSNFTNTPNMNLILPDVGVEAGPLYADDLNDSLTLIDGHNHTPGYGVPIPLNALSSFPITTDLNFGSSFGLVAPYLKSTSANIAQGGVLELAHTDFIAWRNQANTADLGLSVNSSDQLLFNGFVLATVSGSYVPVSGGTMTGALVLPNGTDELPSLALGNVGTGFSQGGTLTQSDIEWSLNSNVIGAWLWNRLPGGNTGLTTTGTIASGSAIISGLASISNVVVGMNVRGANIPSTAIVFSIDSANQITFRAQNNVTATANATEAITFSDPGSLDMVAGSQTIPMLLSLSGGQFSFNSSDWATPTNCILQGGNSFADTVGILADGACYFGFGSGLVTSARSAGLAGWTMFYNEARFAEYTYTGNTIKGVSTITSLSSTTHLIKGMIVSGTGIISPTFVKNISGSTVTLTQAANATGTGASFTFYAPSGIIDSGGGWTLGPVGVLGNIHTIYGKVNAVQDGIQTKYSSGTFSNPPTNAQIVTAFGSAATAAPGFMGLADHLGAGTIVYAVWSNGVNWFYALTTQAV